MANKKFSQFTNQSPTSSTFFVGYDGANNVRMPSASVGAWNLVTETTTSRTAADKEFILINNSTCTITLPAPVAQLRVAVKVVSSVTSIQVKTNAGGVQIDGVDHSTTGLPLTSQWEQRALICDGTHWYLY